MTREELIEILKPLKDDFNHFNADEKKQIKELCVELGVEANFKTRCNSCYKDAFLLICNQYEITSKDLEIEKKVNEKYSYMLSKPAYWYSTRYGRIELNEYTKVDMIEAFIEDYPNQTLYKIND